MLYKILITKAVIDGIANFAINFPSGAEPSSILFVIEISLINLYISFNKFLLRISSTLFFIIKCKQYVPK